jgi:Ca2+-binding EF-hand superfamily protein
MARSCGRMFVPLQAVVLALSVLAGCWRSTPAPVPTAVVKPASSPIPVKPVATDIEPSAAESVSAPGQDEVSADVVTTDVVTSDPAAQSRPVSKERIILLAPLNPIIIDLQLSIDGEAHPAALAKLVDHVLKIADADADGRTMWKELCACKQIKFGQYGNLAIDNENSEKQIIDRYDTARDGVVGREELPRFLTRNAGASRPFSIRGTFDYRDRNRRGAPTWQVFDADDDGVISPTERQLAAALLASRDSDDDEILLPADLNPRLQTPDQEMMAERRRRGPDAARLLGSHADWGNVQLALEHEYGGGRFLREDSFPLTPQLFAQLDQNKDGRIKRDEFRGLNDVPPHVVIAAGFGKEGAEIRSQEPGARSQEPGAEEAEGNDEAAKVEKSGAPRLKLISIVPELAGETAATIEQPGRLTLAVGGILLTFYTNDTVASDDFSARAKQSLGMFDQNKDGYLVKEEVPETLQMQLGRFEAVDADEDGKAYPHEIEAFLAQQQAGLRAQIHAKAGDQDDALFTALDADRDQRLDSREIEGAAQRLAALDKNADGQLTPDELPEMLLIGLARGSLENADATFAPPPVIARRADDKAPRWFTAMDANSDGAISQREFLGPAARFAELDRDRNGLLELSEAGNR